ncbi:phosphomannomutase/phosphoglucomutase [Nesterenkonia xinjiangensis]|uniref:phosphomannomutase/phosphoglucomutase n=1 Tax=Nesterenkonia xinjiangensis TaxID=225327 RepID=UPI0015CE13D6|nr:phosphomannomutase/phosphoglucomutase [Nesterenkonia xinjiangensis]
MLAYHEPVSIDLSASFKAYDVRGLVGETITEDSVRAVGAAFVDVLNLAGRRVLVGGDMRPSSEDFSAAFSEGARARGADVVQLGLISTDMLYFASGTLQAPGVVFTASHNPAGYNGMKMSRAGAVPLSADTGLTEIRDAAQALLDAAGEDGVVIPAAEHTGTVEQADQLHAYAAYLRSLVDLSSIRPLKVVVDAANGMAGLTTPAVLGDSFLDALPLEIVPLYFELDGTFPNHPANPLESENLRDLQAAVVEHGADIGLAFDGDADRCFVIDESGEPVSPSAVTALVARREIARARAEGEQTPVIIHNLITSRAVPELVEAEAGRAVETRVGHSFIKAVMAQEQAVFGGEHSAHYYFRDFFNADTGMLAAMHVLAALGRQELPLSELAAEYSPYYASGEINSEVEDKRAAAERVQHAFAERDTVVSHVDGLTVRAGDGTWWFNLRPSNTEPFLRFNGEAHSAARMESVRDEVLEIVRG